MAIEKKWPAVAPRLFTSNGTALGVITVLDTADLKVKQKIAIKSNTQNDLQVEVKKVISRTQLIVGPVNPPQGQQSLTARTDVSAYTVADGAFLYAEEQDKIHPKTDDIDKATYEQEPTVARRSYLVDKYGNGFDSRVDSSGVNRLAVDGQFSAEVDVQVDIDADGYYDPVTNPDPDSMGIIAFERALNPTQANQRMRLSSVQGVTDTTHRSLDVALHDANGNGLSSTTSGTKRRLNIDTDGVYDATNNTDPSNTGIVLQTRNANAADARQIEQVTAIQGTVDTTHRSMDVAIHDKNGNGFDSTVIGSARALTADVIQTVSPINVSNTGTIAALSSAVQINIVGQSTTIVTVTGTWVGELTPQGSADGGTTWSNIIGMQTYGQLISSIGSNQSIIIPCGGWNLVRMVATNWTSGTATVRFNVGHGVQATAVYQFNPDALKTEIHGNYEDGTDRTVLLGTNGELRTLPKGFENAGNSTTTPLLAGQTFTGTWIKVTDYAMVSFTVASNVASATNGLSIQWGPDGVNIDRTENSDLSANVGRAFALSTRGRYFRIVYTNGINNQTTFRIATDLHPVGTGIVTRPLNQTITDSNFAQLVTSVITGKNTQNAYVPHRSNSVSSLGVNSTNTPLLANATYTGQWEDVLGFANIAVSINVSHASATNGLILEYSNDGINVHDNDFYTISANNGQPTTVGVTWRYFRVRYINGSTNQTSMSLATYYSISAQKPSSHRIDDTINGQNDAELVKAVFTGKDPNDTFSNVRVQGSHDGNSSSVALGANGVFRGTWFPWQANYVKLISDVKADVTGTLFIDLSQQDNPINGTEDSVDFTFPTVFNPAQSSLLRKSTPIQSRWVRHRYVNGPIAQTMFGLDAAFTTADTGVSAQALSALPLLDSQAGIVRAVLTVPNADATGYSDIQVGTDGSVKTQVGSFKDDILLRPLNSALAGQLNVGTSVVRMDPTPLANRRVVDIFNQGPVRIAMTHDPLGTFTSASRMIPVNSGLTMSIDATVPVYCVAENLGGIQSVLTRSPASASGTATNPNNVISNNNTYANITAAAQTITATGYTAGTSNPLVSVKLGIKGNKTAGIFQTVVFQDNQTGSAGNVATVSTTSAVTAATNHFYVAAVTRRNTLATVTSVTGLGLTWIQLASQSSTDKSIVDVWYAIGTPTGSGIVTANMSTSAVNSHIAVSRYSNVNPSSPIQAFATNFGTNNTPTTAAIAVTNQGMAYMANSGRDKSVTSAGAGYTLISSEITVAAGNSDSLATEIKAITVTGTDTPSATLSGNSEWAAISLSMNPAPAVDPIVKLSYTLSAIAGATSGNITFTSGTDAFFTVDITGDRSWTVSDIPNVNVIATGITIATAAANIDYMYLELTDTTGITSRVSIWQGARAT